MGSITIDRNDGGIAGQAGAVPNLSNATTLLINNDTDNLALPATTSGAYVLDLGGGDQTLTGVIAPASGSQESYWIIGDPDKALKLKHDDSNSSAVNRFYLPDSGDYDMKSNVLLMITYNPVANKWHIQGDGKH